MSFEEEFDRIIRQKTDEADFPFDEKNWEKARHLLDAQRKVPGARNNGKFYAGALLLLSFGITGWLVFGGTKGAPLSLQTPVSTDQKSLAVTTPIESNGNSSSKTAPERMSSSVAQPVQQLTRPSLNATMQQKHPLLLEKHLSSNTWEAPQNTESNVPQTRTPSSRQAMVEAPVESKPSKKDEAINRATEETPVPVVMEAPSVANQDIHQPDEPISAQVNSLAETPEMPYEPLSYLAFPIAASGEAQLLPVTFNHLSIYDEDYYKLKRHTQFLNVEAGASYLAGWDTKAGKDGKGFNWFGGLNYGIYLSKKIGVGLGIQLYNVSHIGQPFYSNSKTEYGFGSTSSQTVITSNSLYYGAIPVKFYYNINAQNQVGLGANVGMVMSSRNTVENYGLSDNVRVSASKSTNMGVYQGINTTNVMLSAFYKTQLGKRLYANGEIMYGVSDIFKNLNTVNKERVLGIRLSLQYTLFNK